MATRRIEKARKVREPRATRTQIAYLKVIVERGTLNKGWGGYSSTLTIRLLEERGLVEVRVWPQPTGADDWSAQITAKGRELLARSEA